MRIKKDILVIYFRINKAIHCSTIKNEYESLLGVKTNQSSV